MDKNVLVDSEDMEDSVICKDDNFQDPSINKSRVKAYQRIINWSCKRKVLFKYIFNVLVVIAKN